MSILELSNKLRLFIKTHHYLISVIVILLVATLMRFYDFNNHWGLGNDDSRDALIAKEAIIRQELPQIGSFSSAGPFVFGPLFYWVVILSYLIMPFTYVAPWIFTGAISVLIVLVLIYCGKVLGGNRLALIVGIFAATSPQLIARSLSLGQHSYVALTASLLFLCFILLWQTKKSRFAFGMGLSLGAALSMHYQTINLLIFLPVVLLVPSTTIIKKLGYLVLITLGFIVPSLPIIIWDSQQQFANFRNILDYILVAQYRLYVPNSWRLFLSQHLPQYWSFMVGGNPTIGVILMLTTPLIFMYLLIKKNLPNILLIAGGIFAILLVVNRYYRGERSEGYLLYLLPFILIFNAYAIHTLISGRNAQGKFKLIFQAIGALLFFAIIIAHIQQFQKHITYQSPVSNYEKAVDELIIKYPDQKFSIYDYKWQYSYLSQPLSFLLQKRGKIDKNGIAIGFKCTTICDQTHPLIGSFNGAPIFDLTNEPNLKQKEWVNVNQSTMYDDLMKWSKTEKLQSNFSL